ncbi:hypothetical protein SDC9_63187 [bioreactor metagenome]|uniref:Uncharacterized protein n=1 Tax=bioreactor metagenome TaxID=1076179 RepID=A0A644XKU0_9ZZZZ
MALSKEANSPVFVIVMTCSAAVFVDEVSVPSLLCVFAASLVEQPVNTKLIASADVMIHLSFNILFLLTIFIIFIPMLEFISLICMYK